MTGNLRGTLPALGTVCLLVLAACGDPPEQARWHDPATAAPATSRPPPAPPPITLAFAGDVHFTDRTRDLLADPPTAVGPFAPVLRAADFAMVNLETAVTDRGTPEPKTFHFRAPRSAYQALQAAGVDAVSLANNHALDYGQVGLSDTLAAAEDAGMPYVGAGPDATAAYAPASDHCGRCTAGGVRLLAGA